MLTRISWAPDAEKEEKIVMIPRIDFDCPKLNKGVTISFDIEEPDGNHVLTILQVSQVIIEVGWNILDKKIRKRTITPACQFISVKSIEPRTDTCPYKN